MRKLLICGLLLGLFRNADAQKYFTRNGEARFFSKTAAENIEAANKQVLAVIDASNNQVAFNLLVKGFLFEKQLMQDHFNEEVMESDKYPKASFTGKITDPVNLAKDGKYQVHVSGQLAMHGVSKPVTALADIEVANGTLKGKSTFNVAYDDYNIKLPSLLQNSVAKTIQVVITISCNAMNK
ncbi:YceI-like domain-containing protein [Chitinophaga terrae (ex Kim and Jung 2007)]|uniref:YceI-like domain-containing protein n=1 Tax=Chitinophaga terrae (ex Kim and Jung 2007) TaxID=408074 RepID=A0A1H3Z9W3_9BACT|nr:YceI family protein [Chitinophaga terrae (ex Kim and Jung 2007)]MDQ0109269.1 polyisoprenoid-binding protein YceI [Chitinophaga terrae (ex Kim and Jung 2007)]GEP88633.1 hypothetical protein CTE07_02780 [Chitinophaga terrae (ex Kim and Jung 2007)]SEA20154.1 YceI-like domain-containing protein [Chitinophaga terrae (ex Kim and Jung 2007)]